MPIGSSAVKQQDPELDQISTIQMQQQESTKDSTANDLIDGSSLNKLRAKTKAQQEAAMKRQRAIIQDMSKNIQRDILNKKIEPVDLNEPGGLHVLNRHKREQPNEEELKRF